MQSKCLSAPPCHAPRRRTPDRQAGSSGTRPAGKGRGRSGWLHSVAAAAGLAWLLAALGAGLASDAAAEGVIYGPVGLAANTRSITAGESVTLTFTAPYPHLTQSAEFAVVYRQVGDFFPAGDMGHKWYTFPAGGTTLVRTLQSSRSTEWARGELTVFVVGGPLFRGTHGQARVQVTNSSD